VAKRAFVLADVRTTRDATAVFGASYPNVGLVARVDVLQRKPELAQKLVNAFVKTDRWIASHSPEEIAAKMPDDFKQPDPKLYVEIIRNNKETFSPNGLMDEKGVAVVVKTLAAIDEEIKNANVQPATLFDNRYVNQALGRP